MNRLALLLALAVVTPLSAGEGKAGHMRGELPGPKKKDPALVYACYAPRAYDPAKPAPLFVAIHGGRGTADQIAKFLTPFAEATGAVLACPQGFEEILGADGFWWQGNKQEMAAVERLIAHAQATYSIDPARISLFGLADGGELAARFAFSADRKLNGLLLLNILWDPRQKVQAPKSLKVAVFACEEAQEKVEKLKDHAERAAADIEKAGLPVVLRLHPGRSRSFFHRWETDFAHAHEWFCGTRDWKKELADAAPPAPPK